MISKNQIEKEIAELDILKVISRAYAQIASLRIKKMRSNVLQSRDYLSSINEVFQDVLSSYLEEAQEISKKKGGKKGQITFLSHNGRTVAVLLSANSRLYGDLILRTFQVFLKEIRSRDVEVTIIGKYGLALFEEAEPDRPFTYFDFPDSYEDQFAISSIISHLVQYEKINFYYPEFQNAITQKPQMLELSSGTALTKDPTKKKVKYLFEPSLEAILTFFEAQVFTSMMQQTLQESQLAKFASRVVSMDRANQHIADQLKKVKLEKLKFSHLMNNKKQLHQLAGMNLWR